MNGELDEFDALELGAGFGESLPEPPPMQMHAAPPQRDGTPRIDNVLQIPVVLQVVVGSTTIPVSDLLSLGRGAVIPLDSRVGDPVEVFVNGREIARGEVVVIEDDNTRFGVSLTEIIEPQLGASH